MKVLKPLLPPHGFFSDHVTNALLPRHGGQEVQSDQCADKIVRFFVRLACKKPLLSTVDPKSCATCGFDVVASAPSKRHLRDQNGACPHCGVALPVAAAH
jgi:hypothetical protein